MNDPSLDQPWWVPLADALSCMPDDSVLYWYSDEMDRKKPWEAGYVLVRLFSTPAWAIGPPWEDENPAFDILWPPDVLCMVLHELQADCTCGECYEMKGVLAVPPPGLQLELDLVASIERVQNATVRPHFWTGVPGWTALAVTRAIQHWCRTHVGRNIRVLWAANPADPLTRIAAAAAAIESGAMPTYLIKPGENEGGQGYSVRVSDSAMEALLRGSLLDDEDQGA